MKTLGFLPGPILFGHVVDSYCTVWQDTCGVRGRCFDYDIDKLSNAVCVLGISFTCKFCMCNETSGLPNDFYCVNIFRCLTSPCGWLGADVLR